VSNAAIQLPTNRLAREKSPYLLQHQHNPVDWRAWGDEAFEKARQENKPVFLSIGYSTCHWCHVMERESFEDDAVARFLNEHFVAIKVDREERPDVDQIYMTFVQAISGQGGWPLNVFLTPDLKPFYGGTYFPPQARHGKPSFQQTLERIHQLWETRHGDILDSAEDLHLKLQDSTRHESGDATLLSPDTLHNAARLFKREYDPKHGGFGGAPKFPRPCQPAFLLHYGVRFRDDEAVKMVLHTCKRMAAGGMCDQLGGGFARYSVDAEWLVPHFEKMLYDNAQLIRLYLDAFLASGDAQFADVARDTIRYALRDMTDPGGGFYSAEDADSEGKEGRFYCWTRGEMSELLATDELDVAVRHFGVTERGNFLDHSDPDPLPHQNVLSIVDPNLSKPEQTLLESAKRKLFEARARRVRPHLDDKILSSWNGLMLGAIARAHAVLGDESYRIAAGKNLAFIRGNLWAQTPTTDAAGAKSDGGGILYHRWRDGEHDTVQLLDAYAFLLDGVLDLYEATLEPGHLEFAMLLVETMLAKFYDPDDGGFWQSAADSSDLILRVKEDYDGAEPSGNSIAILCLLRLAAITRRAEFRTAAEKSLRLFSGRMHQMPQAVPLLVLALDRLMEVPMRIAIIGPAESAATRELIRAAHSVFLPNKIVVGNTGPVDPYFLSLPVKESPAAFVCTGTACQAPVTKPEDLVNLLRRQRTR